jgi:hypothetical protein
MLTYAMRMLTYAMRMHLSATGGISCGTALLRTPFCARRRRRKRAETQ